jgi:hypothetical protein
MKAEEFKNKILEELTYKSIYAYEFDNYDNNPYDSFNLKINKNCISTMDFELRINGFVTFYCAEIDFNGYTGEIVISDKFGFVTDEVTSLIKADKVEDVKLILHDDS